jgi:catechol 2,3-dioxygenase-like lactoylglutathione lyase family enzyme
LRLEFRRAEPSGGTRGTPLDHLAFQVPDVREAVERVRGAGYPIVTREVLPASIDVDHQGVASVPSLDTHVAFTSGPDSVVTELLEYAGPPIAFHHLHMFAPDPAAMREWYVRALGATPTMRGPFASGEFAGVRLSFSAASWAMAPTRGRAIERIAFELRDTAAADAVVKALRAAGADVEAEPPVAVDPWGTAIEIRADSQTRRGPAR